MSVEVLLPGSQIVTFLLCPYMVKENRGTPKGLFYSSINPHHEALPSWPSHLLKPLPPETITGVEAKISIHELGRHKNSVYSKWKMALISVLSATRVSLHMFSYNVNLSHQDECSNGKNLVKKNVFFLISLALILLFFFE